MIELNIPGREPLQLDYLVCDVNGTLAVDGQLIAGLADRLGSLRDRLELYLVTADTHGTQAAIDQQLGVTAIRLQRGDEATQKEAFVRQLGAEHVVAIGQGVNDARMLKVAGLGICVGSPEATAVQTLLQADLFVADIFTALDLLEKPIRIVASLRQ